MVNGKGKVLGRMLAEDPTDVLPVETNYQVTELESRTSQYRRSVGKISSARWGPSPAFRRRSKRWSAPAWGCDRPPPAPRSSSATVTPSSSGRSRCARASIEKFATEIRHLQRTEVREVEEPFTEGQKGVLVHASQAKPDCLGKFERQLRGYALAALEDVPLWHERDISHSSVERVIVPDATIVLDFMLQRFACLMEDLRVYPERMRQKSRGHPRAHLFAAGVARVDRGAACPGRRPT